MFIRSERLFLRPAWPEDAHELHAVIGDERVVSNLTSVPWPYGLDDAREFVARAHDRRHPALLITMPSARGSRIVGGIGLREGLECSELGYWLSPEVWGRGLATEAARAILRLAHTLGHREVVAYHFNDDPASGRVLSKLGFQPTGRVVMRHSPERGVSAASSEYRLRLNCPGNFDPDPESKSVCEIGARAA